MLRAQEASLRQELQVTFDLKCANTLRALGFVIDVTLTCTATGPVHSYLSRKQSFSRKLFKPDEFENVGFAF